MIWLLACTQTPVEPAPDTQVAQEQWVALDAPRLLRRMSLDLRGVLPSEAELDAVEADPGALDALRAAYLDDALLEDRLVDLLGQRWHTQIDEYLFQYAEYGAYWADGVPEYAFERSVGNEPLHLMARVVVQDRPWSDVVTAETTVANELLGGVWPLDYPAGETGWRQVHYTDGRPAAGVLSTNGLWWRYFTTTTNYNRGRAALLSRQLVCVDFVGRPVDLDQAPSLSEGADLEQALRTEPYCQGCHAALDPIAATLFGFWTQNEHSRPEYEVYHPEREPQGALLMDVEPAWFGQPVDGLAGLGQAIAADPRFDACAVQSFAEMVWRRPVAPDDAARLTELQAVYDDADGRIKPLLAALTQTPEYTAAEQPGHTDTDQGVVRMMTPQLLASSVHDATGFEWMWEGYDQLDNSVEGYRTLGGGVDGEYVTQAQRVPSASQLLVVRRVAEAASMHAVESGALPPPDDDVSAWVAQRYWQLTAVRPTDDQVADLVELHGVIDAVDGADAAAAGVLSAVLQDPEFWTW